MLDDRALMTPARAPVVVPAREIAVEIANEWRRQDETIRPASMPLTRLVNTIVDAPEAARMATLAQLQRDVEGDLLFYRASEPDGLVTLQKTHWDPVVEATSACIGAPLVTVRGVMPAGQPPALSAWLDTCLRTRSGFTVVSLYSLAGVLGSVLLAMAYWRGKIDLECAWKAAHVDEDWNIRHWGEDAQARQRRAHRLAEGRAASFVLRHTGDDICDD